MASTRARIATAVALAIATLAVTTVAVLYELIVLGLGSCGGDGGSPNAAPASPQGRVCDVLDHGGMAVVIAVEVAALVAAAVVIGLWARRRVGAGLALGCAVAAAFLPLVGLWALSSPANGCSKADEAAYMKWVDKGQHVAPGARPPADCGRY